MNRASAQMPILIGFGAMLLILTAVVLANIYQIHVFSEQIRAIVLERNKKSDLAALMSKLHGDRYRSLVHASALTDPFERDDEIRRFREMARDFIKARDQFLALPLDDNEIATWESIRAEVRKVEAESEAIVDYLQADYLDTAKAVIKTRLAPHQEQMMSGWGHLLHVQNEKNKEALSQSNQMDGELRHLSIVFGGIAVAIGLSVALFAIRTSNRLASELWDEKERAQVTLESISEAVLRLNGRGEICYLNPYAEFLLDTRVAPGSRCKPVDVLQLVDKTTRASLLEPLLNDLRRDLRTVLPDNVCLVTAAGMEYDVEGSGAPLRLTGEDAMGAVIVLRDVTERRDTLRRLTGRSGVDPITGLTDARLMEERLAGALLGKRSEDQPLGFMLIRFDNLAEIEASAGGAGRQALFGDVARMLRMRLRDSDMISRFDDTGFGVILPTCPEVKATEIAEELRQAFARYQLHWDGRDLPVVAHVGGVQIPPFTGTLDDCLRAAGAA
jgi:diguanylate cyclase (GGDEF)-like protein